MTSAAISSPVLVSGLSPSEATTYAYGLASALPCGASLSDSATYARKDSSRECALSRASR